MSLIGTILLVFLAVIAAGIVVWALFFRSRMKVWGLTEAEKAAALPGDELIPTPRWGFKQAITVHAPPEFVWPWLVQMGYQRAGWYSLDAVEKAIGAGDFVDGHSSVRIVPELQTLQVGDVIKIAEPLPYTVNRLEENRLLLLYAASEPAPGQPAGSGLKTNWTFALKPQGEQSTRLFARFVFDAPATFGNTMAFGIFTHGGALLMSPSQLKGIKQRAEAAWQAAR